MRRGGSNGDDHGDDLDIHLDHNLALLQAVEDAGPGEGACKESRDDDDGRTHGRCLGRAWTGDKSKASVLLLWIFWTSRNSARRSVLSVDAGRGTRRRRFIHRRPVVASWSYAAEWVTYKSVSLEGWSKRVRLERA